jgi:hypothetical protein
MRIAATVLLVTLSTTLAGASVETPPPAACQPPCTETVFTVERTKNANELVYSANLTPDGFHRLVPLYVYWLMKAKGGKREELTNVERDKAYGLKFAGIDAQEVRFSVKALEGVPFRARETTGDDGARVTAYATVEGEEMAVQRVFITTKEGGLFPKVLYIDFFGTSAATHEPVVHRFVPKGAATASASAAR